MIKQILGAAITTYPDNGQTMAYVEWLDGRNKTGTTYGDPQNAHMQALLARAKREGVAVVQNTAG